MPFALVCAAMVCTAVSFQPELDVNCEHHHYIVTECTLLGFSCWSSSVSVIIVCVVQQLHCSFHMLFTPNIHHPAGTRTWTSVMMMWTMPRGLSLRLWRAPHGPMCLAARLWHLVHWAWTMQQLLCWPAPSCPPGLAAVRVVQRLHSPLIHQQVQHSGQLLPAQELPLQLPPQGQLQALQAQPLCQTTLPVMVHQRLLFAPCCQEVHGTRASFHRHCCVQQQSASLLLACRRSIWMRLLPRMWPLTHPTGQLHSLAWWRWPSLDMPTPSPGGRCELCQVHEVCYLPYVLCVLGLVRHAMRLTMNTSIAP